MRRRYRLLIVEDEQIERDALAMMIKYNRGEEIREIKMVENGIAAMEIWKEFRADIVLMDINLPGMNGLDVIRQMKQENEMTRFIIVSAHNLFVYAQEALRLGVHEFLVKPIKLEVLLRVLDEAMEEIEGMRHKMESSRIQKEKMKSIRPLLESDCVFSIASMRSNTPVNLIFDFMQIHVAAGYVFIISSRSMNSLLVQKIKDQVRNIGVVCIGEMIHSFGVFVALSEYQMTGQQIRDTMEYIISFMKKQDEETYIGVGNAANCADDLRKSYEQAMQAVRYASMKGKTLVFGNAHEQESQTGREELYHRAEIICEAIQLNNKDKIAKEIGSFFASSYLNETTKKNLELAYWLYTAVCVKFPEASAEIFFMSAEQFFAYHDLQALQDVMVASFCELSDMQKNTLDEQKNPPNQIVAAAVKVVREQYMNSLNLDDVANMLNVSIFYLSKLFKKHTGQTFTEYLTAYRVERAKEFLERTDLSIKETAYRAGFNSQGYFAKIFKKYVNLSPSEYKEKIEIMKRELPV